MIRKRKVKNKKLINMGRIVVVQVGFLKMNCKGFFVIILMFDSHQIGISFYSKVHHVFLFVLLNPFLMLLIIIPLPFIILLEG